MVEFTGWLYECHLSAKLQETITKLTNFVAENPGGNEDECVLEQLILKLEKLNANVIEISDDKDPSNTELDKSRQGQVVRSGDKAVVSSSSSVKSLPPNEAVASSLSSTKSLPPWIIDHIVCTCCVLGEAALDANLRDPGLLDKIHRPSFACSTTPPKPNLQTNQKLERYNINPSVPFTSVNAPVSLSHAAITLAPLSLISLHSTSSLLLAYSNSNCPHPFSTAAKSPSRLSGMPASGQFYIINSPGTSIMPQKLSATIEWEDTIQTVIHLARIDDTITTTTTTTLAVPFTQPLISSEPGNVQRSTQANPHRSSPGSWTNSTPANSEHSSRNMRSFPNPATHHCTPVPSPTPAQFSIAPTSASRSSLLESLSNLPLIPHPCNIIQPAQSNCKYYIVFAGTRMGIFGDCERGQENHFDLPTFTGPQVEQRMAQLLLVIAAKESEQEAAESEATIARTALNLAQAHEDAMWEEFKDLRETKKQLADLLIIAQARLPPIS
ncbi:hypothetical protein GYMLUDRAFT_249393 [Collybiopsis luxurians FD-317 M1]|uniref:Uncharacterized protein n=1 Tax=Collybiopsis luxurians FD-317 M1 TaxID=944289 RepID=A0A0D0BIS3_9AGAR|nr:hypothetical protein GYMLUDRAFT_249393 [Collybiopsis luxurians FD-317 M1]